jgi:arsenite-transporting ATPase
MSSAFFGTTSSNQDKFKSESNEILKRQLRATVAMKDLEISGKRLLLFGGKGGVGKTTCAAATALHFARIGKRTLIISSDPTPSLSDIFETRIGAEETPVESTRNLYALEVGSDIVLQRWKEKYGPEIYEVVSSFLPVEYDIVDYIGGAPGIEEEYMLGFILDLVKGNRYELVVWDTAPAGHTLHLLKMPERFMTHLEAAAKVYARLYTSLQRLRHTLRLRGGKRSVIDIIDGWRKLAEEVMEFITDPSSTEFIVVTIPEALGVNLTERMLATLKEAGITPNYLVINNVITTTDSEFLRARRKMQQEYIDHMTSKFGKEMRISLIPLFPHEIKGIERLEQVAEILFSG